MDVQKKPKAKRKRCLDCERGFWKIDHPKLGICHSCKIKRIYILFPNKRRRVVMSKLTEEQRARKRFHNKYTLQRWSVLNKKRAQRIRKRYYLKNKRILKQRLAISIAKKRLNQLIEENYGKV